MWRKWWMALALALIPLAAGAFDPESMSEAEHEAFGEAVRAYLIANPEVIVEAIDTLEARRSAAAAQIDKELIREHHASLFADGVSHIIGEETAEVTIVEFVDYRCGYCRRAFPEMTALVNSDPSVRLVLKEFPILGEDSVLAARFAIAARNIYGGESYEALHEAMMQLNVPFSEATLSRLVEGLGIDPEPVLEAMNAEEVTRELQDNRQLAHNLGLQGTPSFVLGEEILRGYLPEDEMKRRVEIARAALAAAG